MLDTQNVKLECSIQYMPGLLLSLRKCTLEMLWKVSKLYNSHDLSMCALGTVGSNKIFTITCLFSVSVLSVNSPAIVLIISGFFISDSKHD